MMVFQRGDFVEISAAGDSIKGMVTLASPNGKSLMVMFDGMIDGHLTAMPLSYDDASEGFISLLSGTPVALRPLLSRERLDD